MAKTKIEWATHTWNPTTGCSPVSEGCQNCYARRMSKRLAGRYGYPSDEPFRVTLHPDRLEEPLRWRKPRRVFVCSMGDLFHPDVPASFITQVYEVMAEARQHTFIVLTKRPERIIPVLYGDEGRWYLGGGDYLPNIWHLTTAENQEMADKRMPELLKLRGYSAGWPVLGASVEPMLGPVDLTYIQFDKWTRMNVLEGCGITTRPGAMGQMLPNAFCEKFDWVIAGGETGPGARPIHPDWVRSLRDQCQDAGVSFFFKGWGEWHPVEDYGDIYLSNRQVEFRVINPWGEDETKTPITHMTKGVAGLSRVGKKAAGRLLDGREWNEFPKVKV